MAYNHREYCEAPICQDDIELNWKNDRVWCPDEKICRKKPYLKFQKKQLMISKEIKKGTFRNIEKGYTADDLENRCI